MAYGHFLARLAELVAKYLRKGSLIHLEGRLKTRTYQDGKEAKKFVTEIIGDKFIMLDKRSPSKGGDAIDALFNDPLPF